MQIKPDEITSILKSRIEGLDAGQADLTEVGTVLSVADGIARIHGLENCMSFEMLELPHDVTGLALNLESDNVGAVLFGPWGQVKEGDTVKRTNRLLEIPVGEALLGRIIDPLGRPLDGKGDINLEETRPGRVQGPGRRPAPAGEGAAPDRHQGDRRDDPDRPRPARADHRRPPDRQDGDRDRHDHQQQGLRRRLDLRRDRAAHGHGRGRGADARGGRRDGLHDHRRGRRGRGGADQVPRAVRGRVDRRVLPLQGRARADGLRRPHQARVRLPPDVAAAAPPAGSRGLPGRRLLPALPPARARLQAVRRARRRVDDVAAGHRDAGRRRVGLHPDERDLDHRRADLPRAEAVLLGRAPGDQRRHLGVARRRQRPDRADEEGRRPHEGRAVAVPRPRGVRVVRLRPRRGHAAHARARQPPRADPQPGRAPADPGGRAGRDHLRRDQRLRRSRLREPRRGVPPAARRAPARRGVGPAREDRRRRLVRRDPGAG